MSSWVNRTVLSGSSVSANGSSSHTCTFAPATSGNLLVAIVGGAVTFTTPTGWTLVTSAINNCGLYVFTKTASSGESSFSTTHNGSNYAIQGIVYEFYAGTTVLGSNSTTAMSPSGAQSGPQVTSLSGTYTSFSARTQNVTTGVQTASCAWTIPSIEDNDVLTAKGANDGVYLTIAYDDGQSGSSFNPSATITSNSGTTLEAISFALSVVTPPIAFRNESHVTGSGGNVTGTEPNGVVQGDVLIALFCTDSASSGMGIPAGWTSLYSGLSASPEFRYNLCYIVRGASAPSYAFTISGGTFYRELYIVAFSGADPHNPIDTSVDGGSTSANPNNPDPPAITAGVANTMAVAIGVGSIGSNTGGWTPPGGYTIITNNTAGYSGTIAAKPLSSAGSENPGAFSNINSGASDAWAATVTLKPALAQSIRWSSALAGSSPITFASSGTTAPQAGDVVVIMGSRDDYMISQKEWNLGSLSLPLNTLYVTSNGWVEFGAMYSAPLTAAEATALAGGTVTMQSSDDYAYVVALLAGSDGTLDGVANINSTTTTGATSLSVTGTTTTDDNEIEFAHFDVGVNSAFVLTGSWGTPTGFTVLGSGVTNAYHALSGFYALRSSAGATGTITASMAPGGTGQVAAAFAGAFAFRNTYISDGTTPTVRSWVNFGPGNSGSVTIDRPDGIVDGDMLVLIVAGDGGGKVGNFTLPSGFTIVDQTYTSGSSWGNTNPLLFVATKTASGEPTTYSLTTDTASDVVGTLMAVRDTNGLDTHSTLLNYKGTVGDGSVATQAISTSTANCLVLSAYVACAGSTGLGMTGPSGGRIYARGIGSHANADTSLGVFGATEPSTVSSKTYTATLDYDSDGFAPTAIALAFKPLTGGGGGSTAVTAWLRA